MHTYHHEVKYYECDRMGIIQCNYKHPTTFKDVIDINVWISKLSDLKFDFSYEMKVGGKVVCTAQSTHCFMENNRPVIIAKRLPELYKAISEEV